MNQLQDTAIHTPGAVSPRPWRSSLTLYLVGLLVTVAGVAYVVLDQASIGDLETHLHEVYDPYGKDIEPGVIYGALYGIGALGVAFWLFCIQRVRGGARTARRWSWSAVVVAGLVVGSVMGAQEYGQQVIPLRLSAAFGVSWVLGLAGACALGLPGGAGAQTRSRAVGSGS